MAYRARYFKPAEWRCKCGKCKDRASFSPLGDGLLVYLDLLRAAIGAPILINSGWRCELHNRAVGGAQRSFHTLGRAADITTADTQALWALIERLQTLYLHKMTEVIYYPDKNFIHVAK